MPNPERMNVAGRRKRSGKLPRRPDALGRLKSRRHGTTKPTRWVTPSRNSPALRVRAQA